MKKVVVKCGGFNGRKMKKATNAVMSMSGLKSVHVELEDRELTVIGTVDPLDVIKKLKRIGKKKGDVELAVVLPVENHEELENGKKESETKKKEEEGIQASNTKSNKISSCGRCIVGAASCVATVCTICDST